MINLWFQFFFLAIFWFNGQNLGFGYDTYKKFFESIPEAELHTIEISCIEQGPREEGKWPWPNFAKENKEYENLLDKNLLVSNLSSKRHEENIPNIQLFKY